MNKISLKNLNLKEVEQLSREQLKGVLGGFTGGTGSDGSPETQTSPNVSCDCPNGKVCSVRRGHPEHDAVCERCCSGEPEED